MFTSSKVLRWSVFWLGWLWISPETIIPGAVAVGVGNVFYKERAVNLVTICAAWLGIMAYLMLGHIGQSGQNRSDFGWAWPQSSRSSCSASATRGSDGACSS